MKRKKDIVGGHVDKETVRSKVKVFQCQRGHLRL